MRIGIEIEYWIVDRDGTLAAADEVADACDGAETEFVEPLLEVKTPPRNSIASLSEELRERLRRAIETARERDRRLVPLGTPIGDERVPLRDDPRTEIQRAILGDSFSYARGCAGTHVHFELRSPADQLRALTALDPAFALVNTSPYYRGRRIAACARPYAYRRRCYDPLPAHGRLWRYADSAAEWRERRERRFEEFLDAARASTGSSRSIPSSSAGSAFGRPTGSNGPSSTPRAKAPIRRTRTGTGGYVHSERAGGSSAGGTAPLQTNRLRSRPHPSRGGDRIWATCPISSTARSLTGSTSTGSVATSATR